MNGLGYEKKRSGKVKKIALVLLLPFLLLVLSYTAYKLFFIPAPVIEGIEGFELLPLEKTVKIRCSNLRSIEISILQGLKSVELLRDAPETMEREYTLEVKPKELGLADGPAKVVVKAKSGILKKVKHQVDSLIDTVPPTLRVVDAPSIVSYGMAGLAVLRAEGADSVYMRLDGRRFPAYRAAETGLKGAVSGENLYLVFFPVPFGSSEDAVFYTIAEDRAGNVAVKALPTRIRKKTFRSSSIDIGDDFINRIVYPLLNGPERPDPVKAFLTVNEEWRRRDKERLLEIGRRSSPKVLWKGHFLQLKNSKVMARYGDRRVYLYRGKPISRSVHLGYDLASVRNADVEAANSGVVRFAGDLGIYGNAVVIDHGLGLMSLYGHLSEVSVREGTAVRKGEVIGRTGSSGFAGGDHLHFGVLIHGVEVSPIYWWDPRWVKTQITALLR